MVEVIVRNKRVAKVRVCRNVLTKFLGLMFNLPLRKGNGILLVNSKESVYHSSIHMFFVFYSIDVIWLDSKLNVVDIKKNVKPFTPFIFPRQKSCYVLELWNGGADFFYIGDIVNFVDYTNVYKGLF